MLGAAVHPIPPPLRCQQKARGAGGTGSAEPPVLLPRGTGGTRACRWCPHHTALGAQRLRCSQPRHGGYGRGFVQAEEMDVV